MKTSFLMLVLLFTSTSTFALNIKQKKKLKYWKEEIQKHQQTVAKKCGKEIPTVIDEKMVAPFLEENTSVSGYCKGIMDGVIAVCEGDEEIKKYLMTKITKINCNYNPEKKKLALKLNGTTLEASVGLGAPNLWTETKKWVENNL